MKTVERLMACGVLTLLLYAAGCTSSELTTVIPREYRQMVVIRDTPAVFRIDFSDDRAIPAGVLQRWNGDTITVIGFADVRRGALKSAQRFALTVAGTDTVGIRIAEGFFCAYFSTIAVERLTLDHLEQLGSTYVICLSHYPAYLRVETILQHPQTFTLPRTLDSIAWRRAATFMARHEGEERPLTLGNSIDYAFSEEPSNSDTKLQSGNRKNRFSIERTLEGDSTRYTVTCDTDLMNAYSSQARRKYEEILARRCAYFISTGNE